MLWMGHEARRLHAAGRTVGRSWTLAQVCEHLALAIEGTLSAPPSADPPAWWRALSTPARLKRRLMRTGLLLSGRFPDGVPAPDFVRPGADADLARALARLDRACEAFEARCRTPDSARARGSAPARPWPFHPLLGPMNAARWRRFHTLHARHHFSEMSRPASPDSP